MGTKITVETVHEDGTEEKNVYECSGFTVSVLTEDGVATESSIGGDGDAVALLTGTVASIAGIAKNNGVQFHEIIEMVASGTSDGIQAVIGHKCDNCGKCGKGKAKLTKIDGGMN